MRSKIIMIYPQLGFSGAFVMHAPLGLLYASIELVKNGIEVQILDTRLYPDSWQNRLNRMLDKYVLVVGISVMSGTPIKNAVKIGRFVKSIDPKIKVVWGGPHATFFPDTILKQEWYCDYVVSGYAVKAFYELVECLLKHQEPNFIKGVSYHNEGRIMRIPPDDTKFEFYNYLEIPYDLIEDYSPYGQLDQDKRIFSIYGALGCPYKCSFCSAPVQYGKIKGKKWIPLPANEVVDHIEYLVNKYNANYIYFIDDDSFVNIQHVKDILDEINRRQLHIKLGFRGARINEIKKMSDAFLDKLAAAGTDILHIGAESGSNRMLTFMRKDCTVNDIIECNLKLSKHPQIIAAYNFVIGLPTEALSDLKATGDLMQRLVKNNPNCIIFPPNRYRPVPGTELFEIAQREWNYKMPNTLEEWSNIEVEGDFYMPWHSKDLKKFCNLLLISSYFIDNKIDKVTSGNTIFYKILRMLNALYRPIARFRLKYRIHQCLVEYYVYRIVTKLIKKHRFLKKEAFKNA